MRIFITKLLSILMIAAFFSSCAEKEDLEIKMPDNASKIVTLGGTMTEIIYALGVEDRLVGTDLSSNYPEAAEKTNKVGIWRNVTPESIIGLVPDLVIAMPDSGPDETLKKIWESKIPVYKPERDYSYAWTRSVIDSIGSLTGNAAKADSIIAELDRQMETLESRLENDTISLTALFVYMRGGKALIVGGEGTTAAAALESANLKNIAADMDDWTNVGPEYYASVDPDILVVPEQGLQTIGGLEALANTPGIGEMRAVKEGKVYVVNELAFLGFGPRYPRELAKLLDFKESIININN
ncbi:MAG: hemin ABC transporter substrate-binding protein [Candidatus Kapaibacteriales bacterium]